MYCQNCGAKLEMENQRFCQNCGSEIVPEIPQKTFDMDKNIPTTKPIPIPQYTATIKKGDEPGAYSKRCLGFGIVSLVIGVITLNIGSTFITMPFPYFYFGISRIFIGLAIVHVAGIIFGILSRVNSEKARELEPETSILKAGRGLGIAGLIINIILLFAAIVLIAI
jgi:hypothetical protein